MAVVCLVAGLAGPAPGRVAATAAATVTGLGRPVPCAGRCWRPRIPTTWDWVLSVVPHAPFKHVMMYDIDGFEASARTVASLHGAGIKAACYLSAGSWERWRPDADEYPQAVLGLPLSGWPGERWVDIREAVPGRPLYRILEHRVAMCAEKGFDGIEFDNVDGYTDHTGFPLTAADQLRFDTMLAAMAHRAGMAALLKNDVGQVRALQPYFDGALDEQCNQYDECAALSPFIKAGKPVLNAEYRDNRGFCAADRRAGFDGVAFDLALDGRRFLPCGPPYPRTHARQAGHSL
jgi:hypothetical protein